MLTRYYKTRETSNLDRLVVRADTAEKPVNGSSGATSLGTIPVQIATGVCAETIQLAKTKFS